MGRKIFEKFKEKFPEIAKDVVNWKLNGGKVIVLKMNNGNHVWFSYTDDNNYILRVGKGV